MVALLCSRAVAIAATSSAFAAPARRASVLRRDRSTLSGRALPCAARDLNESCVLKQKKGLVQAVATPLNAAKEPPNDPAVYTCSSSLHAVDDAAVLATITSLGATLDGHGGCVFRVWAPNAEGAVLVLHSEDGGAEARVPMTEDGSGNFAVRAADVKPGAAYHFAFYHGGTELARRDARARFTDYDSDTCYVVDSTYDWAPFQAPSWDEIVLYQLHVGAFTGRIEGKGTFAAMEEHLQHIKDLGFNTIQLMPVTEFSGQWGYNPRLLFTIHQQFGTPEDLRHLVNAAHKLGLGVFFDLVLNHGAAKLNSLWAYDGWNPDNGGGLYFNGGGDTPWGKMFSFGRTEVDTYLIDSALMFLSEYNADGLRFDSVHNMPWKLLQKLTHVIHEKHPGKILISEITPETPEAVNSAGFDSTWIHSTFFDTAKFMRGERKLSKVEAAVKLHPGFSKPTQALKYFLGCHDQIGCRKNGGFDEDINGLHRYPVELFGGRNKWEARAASRMWYAVMAMSAGIPMLFMGTEFHHDGWWHVEPNRCLNWDLAGDEHGRSMMAAVKAANELRANCHPIRNGGVDVVHYDQENCVLGFRRESKEGAVLVVVNASSNQWENRDYGVRVGERGLGQEYEQVLNSQDAAFGGWEGSGDSGRRISETNKRIQVNLPKWSCLVFKPVS